jgi:hypothetical protein
MLNTNIQNALFNIENIKNILDDDNYADLFSNKSKNSIYVINNELSKLQKYVMKNCISKKINTIDNKDLIMSTKKIIKEKMREYGCENILIINFMDNICEINIDGNFTESFSTDYSYDYLYHGVGNHWVKISSVFPDTDNDSDINMEIYLKADYGDGFGGGIKISITDNENNDIFDNIIKKYKVDYYDVHDLLMVIGEIFVSNLSYKGKVLMGNPFDNDFLKWTVHDSVDESLYYLHNSSNNNSDSD